MSTYRLTGPDRSRITATMPMASAGWRVLRYPAETFAAVEAIIAPIYVRAEAAEAEAARWQEKAQEAGAAYGLANAKHHEELDRANRLERLADSLAEKAVEQQDRALAAEKRTDDLAAVIERVRGRLVRAMAIWGDDHVLRDLRALLPDDTKDREEVGTGAGGGATGQDTGTAWDTRSTGCPEDRAQAHLLASPDGTKEADQ